MKISEQSDEPPQVPKDEPSPDADSPNGKHGVGKSVLHNGYTYSSVPYGARVLICRNRLL